MDDLRRNTKQQMDAWLNLNRQETQQEQSMRLLIQQCEERYGQHKPIGLIHRVYLSKDNVFRYKLCEFCKAMIPIN